MLNVTFVILRNKPGPDDIHSLTKDEFVNLISSIKMVEKSSGTGIKNPTLTEQNHLQTNRVSIIAMEKYSSWNYNY